MVVEPLTEAVDLWRAVQQKSSSYVTDYSSVKAHLIGLIGTPRCVNSGPIGGEVVTSGLSPDGIRSLTQCCWMGITQFLAFCLVRVPSQYSLWCVVFSDFICSDNMHLLYFYPKAMLT